VTVISFEDSAKVFEELLSHDRLVLIDIAYFGGTVVVI
jgi:hypothetical protein